MVKLLEYKDRGSVEPSQEDAPFKGGSMEIREEFGVERSTKLGSNDTEEMVNVLSSMEAANILTSGVAAVSISPVAVATTIGVSTVGVSTVSGLVPTVSVIFTIASVLVPLEEVYVEALQREYWKIIRLGGHTAVYQFFVDMLKQFDREDLHQLWILVKKPLTIKQATKEKEKELWVKLKRLFKPDFKDQLWTHNQNFMHDLLEWKLYDTCGVHHVFTKDQEIFMLVEKDYPLRKGLATVMICNKLQVEQYSQIANDLILKIHNIANSPKMKS
nr:hypothetical protein [Tanacetum cinerariifolium]